MRITQNTTFNALRDSVATTRGRMENYQMQGSSLKKLNRPSDDPISSTKVLSLRTDKVNNEQFQSNMKITEAFLNNTDHVLDDISEILVRAKEIAVGQASGASATAETRLGVAEEVTQLIKRAIGSANTKIGDRYLFGGFRTDQAPLDNEGRYQGDDGQILSEIAKDVFVPMNLTALEAFNSNPEQSSDYRRLKGAPNEETESTASMELGGPPPPNHAQNVNVFDELQNLRISLLTNDLDGIRSTLERFDQARSYVVAMRAKVGSRVAGLAGTTASLERQNLTNASLNSSLEDADMVQVMNNIAKEETVLRTVLANSQRLVQPTLIDFLK